MQRPGAMRLGLAIIALMIALRADAEPGAPQAPEGPTVVAPTAGSPDNLSVLLNLAAIEKCARFSRAVYDRPGTAEHERQKEELEQHYDFVLWDEFEYQVSSSRGGSTLKSFLLLRDDEKKEQFVGVAGTDGYADWKVNVQYPFKEQLAGTGIFVQPQFGALATELYDARLKHHLRGDYQTVVTGHSLGGAVAAIIGMLISRDGRGDPLQVYTFGQPKFTNLSDRGLDDSSGVFVQREFPLLRIVNAGDPVPKLPPYSLLKDWAGRTGRYAHLGDELVLTAQGQARFERFVDDSGSIIERNVDVSGVTDWPDAVASIKNVAQHRMDSYVENLRLLVEASR